MSSITSRLVIASVKQEKNDNLGKAKATFFYSWKGVGGDWEGVRTPVLWQTYVQFTAVSFYRCVDL